VIKMVTELKQIRTRGYLAKDFDAFRSQLLQYARLYYPDRIQDFSETSLGGVFLDLASYAGDIMSFYLDHQYGELDPNTAVETDNIERLIRSSGVTIVGASPALVDVTIYIEVPAFTFNDAIVPSPEALPIIKENSIFNSTSGISFNLLADIDFSKKRSDGTYAATVQVGRIDDSGAPISFIMSLDGTCISGTQTSETITFGEFVAFPSFTLSQPNITDILTITDDQGNSYYQVSSLTDDVVYRNVLNTARDAGEISEALKVVPAPYRYISIVDLATRSTRLIFGSGDDTSLENDAVPDPSDFAISLPYSKTFSRTSINPLQMLKTKTLGIYSANSQATVTYRYGGGLSHNVPPETINIINQLLINFPLNPTVDITSFVRGKLSVLNKKQASGGEDAPSIDQLKSLVPSAKNAQERIVTKEDLLSRVYSIPSNFGRVYRAAVRSNPNNPLSTQLFIVSRTPESKLITSADTLKENLKKYLAPYRLVNDAIDILDAYIINLSLLFEVVIDPSLNRQLVLQAVLRSLIEKLNINNFSIDQPIVISDIQNLIYVTPGVLSVTNLEFRNYVDTVNNRSYSDVTFDVKNNIRKGILYPPPGGIFEFRYPDYDIIGRTST
jgi:hypothetical protein